MAKKSAALLGWHWLVIVLIAGIGLIVRETFAVLPMTGVADPKAIELKDLAALSLQSTQYVQGLATAAFGLSTLVLNREWLGKTRITVDAGRRTLLVLGIALIGLSLIDGFVYIEVLVAAAYNQVLVTRFSDMLGLRLAQAIFLLIGVLLIGGTLSSDLLTGTGRPSA